MGWQWFGHFLFPNHASPCGVSSKGENTEHQTQIRTSNSLHQNVFLFTMKLQLFTNCFTLAVVWFPNPEHLLVRLGIKMKVINMSEEIIKEIFVCFYRLCWCVRWVDSCFPHSWLVTWFFETDHVCGLVSPLHKHTLGVDRSQWAGFSIWSFISGMKRCDTAEREWEREGERERVGHGKRQLEGNGA